jgi:hypothetical protein
MLLMFVLTLAEGLCCAWFITLSYVGAGVPVRPVRCGGGVEYLHCNPASRRRRRKGNPVPGGITGPPCSWGTWSSRLGES